MEIDRYLSDKTYVSRQGRVDADSSLAQVDDVPDSEQVTDSFSERTFADFNVSLIVSIYRANIYQQTY